MVPLKWGEIFGYAEEQLMLNPLEGLIWYPEGSFKKSVTVNRYFLEKLYLIFYSSNYLKFICLIPFLYSNLATSFLT